MALARLSGGPLDGQILPLDDSAQESVIVPYSEGQVVYRRAGEAIHTGTDDGPTETLFRYVESTEPIDPSED